MFPTLVGYNCRYSCDGYLMVLLCQKFIKQV
nr:MAG TPA: hypothetical protein [Caudoviricetes sp.]